MSTGAEGTPELWGIGQEDWDDGWRRTLEEAVEAAFREDPVGTEAPLKFRTKKRSGNAVHDYKVDR
jgi:hypothetical protein